MDQTNIEGRLPSEGEWKISADGERVVDGGFQLVTTVNRGNCAGGVSHYRANGRYISAAKRVAQLLARAEMLLNEPDPDFLVKDLLLKDIRAALNYVNPAGWRTESRLLTEFAISSINFPPPGAMDEEGS